METIIIKIIGTVFIILWTLRLGGVWIKSQIKYDSNNRLIFYPMNIQTGYVVNDQSQIDEISKAYKKCFIFKIKEYEEDIKRVLGNCEVINEPLPYKIVLENQAKLYTWLDLIILVAISAFFLVLGISKKNYIFLIIFLPIVFLNIKMIYLKFKIKG